MAKKKPKGAPPAEANGKPRPAPAYFLSMSLENVRCFGEKQTLDLSDGKGGPARWTILLGNNGTGKTTVLQGLVLLFKPLIASTAFHPDGYPWSLLRAGGSEGLLSLEMAIGLLSRTERTAWGKIVAGITLTPYSSIGRSAGGDLPGPFEVPPCCAYGASRRPGPLTVDDPFATDPTATLFSVDAALVSAGEWLLRMDYAASKPSSAQKRQQERLRQITDLLLGGLLPEVDDIRFDAGDGPDPRPRVEFHTPYGWVPLGSLGHGYQSLLAWTVDLANRLVARYPDSPTPLAEPAIVLIDELDLHLHPTWQRQVVGHLTKHFPATQFIATAHSPLIVQGAGDANLAVLRREGDQVKIVNDVDAVRGWRIDQIYTSELFGLPSARPPELDEPLARRQQLLTKPTLSAKDQKELKALEQQIGDLPVGETTEQIKAIQLLKDSMEYLNKTRAPQP